LKQRVRPNLNDPANANLRRFFDECIAQGYVDETGYLELELVGDEYRPKGKPVPGRWPPRSSVPTIRN
jgi:hypothetical protein